MESRLEVGDLLPRVALRRMKVTVGPYWEQLRERRGQGKPKETLLHPVTFPGEEGAQPTPAGGARAWLVA